MILLNKCPNCSSSAIRYWGKTSGPITLHDSWSKCRSCKLVFANPIKTSKEIKDFYSLEFYEEKIIDQSKSEYNALFNWISDLILKYQPKPSSLLEIGCGKGLFLQHFSQKTQLSQIVGVEFDSRVTDKIKLNAPFKAYNDFFETIQFREKFDVIFAWHVIEHVIDLHAFLSKIKHDSNGIVIFGTPALGWLNELKSFFQRLFNKEVTVGTSSDHTYYLSQKVLVNIIKTHGYEVLYKKVYIDNVNDEMKFSSNPIKTIILKIILLTMKITRLPLFGKQILIIKATGP